MMYSNKPNEFGYSESDYMLEHGGEYMLELHNEIRALRDLLKDAQQEIRSLREQLIKGKQIEF